MLDSAQAVAIGCSRRSTRLSFVAAARFFICLGDSVLVCMFFRFVPDTEVVQHQLAQQELESSAALSYEEYLRRLTQAVDTEVISTIIGFIMSASLVRYIQGDWRKILSKKSSSVGVKCAKIMREVQTDSRMFPDGVMKHFTISTNDRTNGTRSLPRTKTLITASVLLIWDLGLRVDLR